MNARFITGGIAVAAIGLLWIFVGFERVVGDHEMGVAWEPFIKHRLSLQVRFENPAQKGLELVTLEALSPTKQATFIEFCAIRFGMTDTAECQKRLVERRI